MNSCFFACGFLITPVGPFCVLRVTLGIVTVKGDLMTVLRRLLHLAGAFAALRFADML